jgi:hypothetical protein
MAGESNKKRKSGRGHPTSKRPSKRTRAAREKRAIDPK